MTQARFFTLKHDKPKMPRAYSDGDLAHYPEMKKSLAMISSGLWQCIDRRKEPNNEGYLYHFELRDELNIYLYPDDATVWEKLYTEYDKVYPAVEPICDLFWAFIPEDVDLHSNHICLIHCVSSALTTSQGKEAHTFYNYLMEDITISFESPEEEENFSALRDKKFELAAYIFKIRHSAKITLEPLVFEDSSHSNNARFLNSLGYQVCFNVKKGRQYEAPLVTLPDLNFIQSRLSRFHPSLTYKKDLYCDDVGSDVEYLHVHLMGFQLQSHTRWFVHDSCAHLSRMLIIFYQLDLNKDDVIVDKHHEGVRSFRNAVMRCYQIINLAFIDLDRKENTTLSTEEKAKIFPEEYTKKDLSILLRTLAMQVDDFMADNEPCDRGFSVCHFLKIKETWEDPENHPLWRQSCGQPFNKQALKKLIGLYEKMLIHYTSVIRLKNDTDSAVNKPGAVTEFRALTLA